MSADVNQGWMALAGAIFGGAGLQIIKSWLGRPKERHDDETEFRVELREDIKTLRLELRKVEAELDVWREKYYSLMDEFVKFKTNHTKQD
jgi:hypothetical protein